MGVRSVEEGDYRASHTAPSHTHTHTHTNTHTHVPLSCPYLDLHLDLQVSPVDGKQCVVRAGGAQLPGAVGHAPVAVSQEDQRGEGGDLAGEGALFCRGGEGRGLHFICTLTHTSLTHFVNGVSLCFTHTARHNDGSYK